MGSVHHLTLKNSLFLQLCTTLLTSKIRYAILDLEIQKRSKEERKFDEKSHYNFDLIRHALELPGEL
jgi:hypothetical protein